MDEADAIEGCRHGNREAFRSLVMLYQNQAMRHAVSLLGRFEDAQDVVQDAFVDAWAAMPKFEPGRRFYPWFYTILRNRCWKEISRRTKRAEEGLSEAVILKAATAEDAERTRAMNQALQRLSPEHREVLLLRHNDGASYEEMSIQLGIAPGTVMSRLFHARRKLREVLEESR